ncbi:hypothetical protein Hanom_Chr00s000004g01608061 [Helianthus anomalus]
MDLSEYSARAHGSEPSARTAREGADLRSTSVYCARAHGSEPSGRTAREGSNLRAHQCVLRARARRSFLLQLILVQLHSAFETDEVNAFD